MSCQPDMKRTHIQAERHVVTEQLLNFVYQTHGMDGRPIHGSGLLRKRRTVLLNLPEEWGKGGKRQGVYALRERPNCRGDAPSQFNIRPIVLVDVRGNGVDMDESAPLFLVPKPRFIFDRVEPYRDYHVTGIEQLVGRLRMKKPDTASEAITVFPRYDSRALIRTHNRQF